MTYASGSGLPAGDPAEHVRIMRRHFALGAAVCGALTLLLAALVPALLPFFFGSEFEPAGTAAKILLLGTLFAALRRILRGIEERRSHAYGEQCIHLVLHQRDERRDDDACALPHESRDLVA